MSNSVSSSYGVRDVNWAAAKPMARGFGSLGATPSEHQERASGPKRMHVYLNCITSLAVSR